MVDEALHFRIPCSEGVLAVVTITVLALHDSTTRSGVDPPGVFTVGFGVSAGLVVFPFSGVLVPCVLVAVEFIQIEITAPSIQSTTRAILPDNTSYKLPHSTAYPDSLWRSCLHTVQSRVHSFRYC